MTVTRELLQTFTPFDSLSGDYLDKALAKLATREYLKGAPLFIQGERTGDSVFLLKGKVELLESNYSTHQITTKSEQSRFALNQSNPLQITAIAKSRVQVLTIELEFLDLLVTWSQSGEYSLTGLQDHHIDVDSDEDSIDWMSNLLRSPLLQKVPPANI